MKLIHTTNTMIIEKILEGKSGMIFLSYKTSLPLQDIRALDLLILQSSILWEQ